MPFVRRLIFKGEKTCEMSQQHSNWSVFSDQYLHPPTVDRKRKRRIKNRFIMIICLVYRFKRDTASNVVEDSQPVLGPLSFFPLNALLARSGPVTQYVLPDLLSTRLVVLTALLCNHTWIIYLTGPTLMNTCSPLPTTHQLCLQSHTIDITDIPLVLSVYFSYVLCQQTYTTFLRDVNIISLSLFWTHLSMWAIFAYWHPKHLTWHRFLAICVLLKHGFGWIWLSFTA